MPFPKLPSTEPSGSSSFLSRAVLLFPVFQPGKQIQEARGYGAERESERSGLEPGLRLSLAPSLASHGLPARESAF